MKKIITISREYGAGGHSIGKHRKWAFPFMTRTFSGNP